MRQLPFVRGVQDQLPAEAKRVRAREVEGFEQDCKEEDCYLRGSFTIFERERAGIPSACQFQLLTSEPLNW
jgi:hypothetical protein